MAERPTRSEKSAEVVVAAGKGRRAEREGVFETMSMLSARRQMSAQAERMGKATGEAGGEPVSDEANSPRRNSENTGSKLLQAALTRENLRQAWKRVKANKGAAGVDGLDIDQTARHLVTAWPTIREQLLRGTYQPPSGTTGIDPETGRRQPRTGYTDGHRSADPTSAAASAATAA